MKLECFVKQDGSNTVITKNSDGNYVINVDGVNKEPLVITSDLFKPRQKLTIFLSQIGVWHVLPDEWMNRSRDAWSFAYYQLMIRNTAVANIYFHDSFDDSILFINYPCVCDLPEMVELNRSVWLHDYFAELYPESDAYLRGNISAKHELLMKVNTVDSITATENQLDLLTEIVGALINGETPPEWASDFIAKMKSTSSVNSTDTVTLIEKTEAFKGELRDNVGEYLSKKQ